MKYINQDYIEIKPIQYAENDYYQIGTDDWNIVVGLGGLIKLKNQASEIIADYITTLNEED